MKQLFFLGLLLLIIPTNAQTNLIKNGGFENEFIDWRGEESAMISPYEKKSGKNGANITQFVDAEWKALDQIISIPKNTFAVECSVWMKTDEVKTQKEAYKAGVVILEFTDASEKQISTENVGQATSSTDWTHYKKIIKIPADAKKIRIMLALAQTSGTVFFDDVKLVALTEQEYSKLNLDSK
ncbi:carbohydrate binding domain-containing protein [Flavobacterium procerum]|uniref:Carbohydrate binding domain-containing protein n=1 Tax=Flavobacterium procerum TaxID=1455569 RepID=A0ABV6BX58_9FLAO